jgi:membrane fusion protein (multidrug efflux system)
MVITVMLLALGCSSKTQANAAPPTSTVQVVKAVQQDVPMYGNWVATLDGSVNAQIQPQVTGYLVRQLYREGSNVRKGEVLFEIDPRPFQAVLDQAKGQLAEAKAKLSLADVNVKRDTPLAKERAIAQSQLDTELAVQLEAKASVQAAEAAVEQAQLNLEFTKVRSLTDGIAGIATAQMGNLVSPTTVLTTVSKVDPIKVYFPISEQQYLQFGNKQQKGSGTVRDSQAMSLELVLSNGNTYPQKGKVLFTDRQIDSQTGTIRLVGAFPNPGNFLRPGQFGRVRALLGVRQGAILVPQRSVSELQGTYQVAVVSADNKASIRKVKVGDQVGSMWVIEDGLKSGEQVISEGTSKVRDGTLVNPTVANAGAEGRQ